MGRVLLLFLNSDVFDLVCIVGGIEIVELEMDEEFLGILEEIGNIVFNGVLGFVGNLFEFEMIYVIFEIRMGYYVEVLGLNVIGFYYEVDI